MTKEWVEEQKKKNKEQANKLIEEIKTYIKENFSEQRSNALMYLFFNCLKEFYKNSYSSTFSSFFLYSRTSFMKNKGESIEEFNKESLSLDILNKKVDALNSILSKNWYDTLMDSEPMEFDGTIIITDPCYIMDKSKELDYASMPELNDYIQHHNIKDYSDWDEVRHVSEKYIEDVRKYRKAKEQWEKENEDDWDICNCGLNMEALGINHYMTRSTIYGDWSCITVDTDTGEKYGNFCADAGMVGVFLLDEVLKYNPSFDYHIKKDWTTTTIHDFKGTVQFVVDEIKGVFKDDSEYHKKGEEWVDYNVHVVGHGINKKTCQYINFKTFQNGF